MMNKQETFKSPAEFTKNVNPPKSPQGMGKKGSKMKMCAKCKEAHKTSEHGKTKKKGAMKMTPASKGHKPKGAHGRAAVKALGRTKTTGNFKKIEESKGKGAAISAYQNKLKARQSSMKHKAAEKKMSGKELLGKAMKRLKH